MKLITLLLLLLLSIAIIGTPTAAWTALTGNWINVSVNNQQTSPLTNNVQIAIPLNALNYSGYLSGGLTNFEVFNGFTGNILYSWLETGNANTVSNGLIWVDLPNTVGSSSIVVVPASTNAVNVITIGFANIGTTLMNGNNVGEAPQLSPWYGEYDNGANVFLTYQNFACPSGGSCALPAGWTTANSGNINNFTTINNGFTLNTISKTSASTSKADISSKLPTIGNVMDEWITSIVMPVCGTHCVINMTASSSSSSSYAATGNLIGYISSATAATANTQVLKLGTTSASVISNAVGVNVIFTNGNVISVYAGNVYSGGSEPYPTIATAAGVSNVLANTGFFAVAIMDTATSSFKVSIEGNWIRTRTPAPANIAPTITFGSAVQSSSYTAPTTPTLALSNTLIDQGQSILFTANIVSTQGTAPFSFAYNVYAYNSQTTTNTLIANMLFTGNSYTSNTWLWTPNPNLYLGNSIFQANVVVVDAHPTTVNSVLKSFGYNSALVAAAPLLTNVIIDIGQKTLLTSQPSGGTQSYSYQWYANYGATVGCTSNGNAITGATSSTYLASPTTSNAYAYSLSDGTTTTNTICSAGSTETTDTAPYANTLLSNTLIDSGQWLTVTFLTGGGTSPFTANGVNVTGSKRFGSGNVIVASIGGSNTISFQITSPVNSNSFIYTWNAVDYGTTTNDVFNAPYNTITVNTALSIGTITPSSPKIDSGQSITLTSNPSGGTLPYTYQWYANYGNSATCSGTGNAISGATSSTYAASPTTTNSYAYLVTDSATTAESGCSASDTITVNPALGTPSLSSSNTLLDSGQWVTLTATPSGGTSPYTYTFYNVTGTTTAISGCTSIALTTCSFQTSSPNQGNVFSYNVVVVDSSSSAAQTTNSIHDSFTVNAVPAATTVSNPLLDSGQTETITLQLKASAGTAPFTGNLINYTTATLVRQGASNVIVFTIGGSNSISFVVSSPTNSNSFTYNYLVTDYGTTANYLFNAIAVSFVVNTPLQTPTLSLSNSLLDSGQWITLTASASGGTQPYLYTFYNVTGTTTAISGCTSIVSNTCSFQTSSPTSANVFSYNVVVIDHATTAETTNSIHKSFTVNAVLAANPITPSAPKIDQGQSITLTSNPSGGTLPYTYQWYANYGNSATCSGTGNAITGATASTYLASPTSTNSYAYQVTDSATTNSIICSSGDTVTVNPALSLSLSITDPILDSGQSYVLNANENGGTSPFSYTFYNTTTGTAIAISSGVGCGIFSASDVCTLVSSSPTQGNVFDFNSVVQDSSYPGSSANSVAESITVNRVMIPSLTTNPGLPATIVVGNIITFTANVIGGTSAYTYNFQVINTITNVLIANQLIVGNAFTSNNFAWTIPLADAGNTVYANVIITDSASVKETTNTVYSSTLTIPASGGGYTPPSTPTLTASNTPTVSPGQYEIFTAAFTGGVGPYTYNFIIINSITNVILANQLWTNALTTNSFTIYIIDNWYGNTILANVIVTDSHPTTVNSIYTALITIGSTSGITLPIFLQASPLQVAQPIAQTSWDLILSMISILFFVAAFVQGMMKNGQGSMLQIGLYISAVAFMFFAVNFSLLPQNVSKYTTNTITLTGATPATIQPFTINVITGSSVASEQVYIKSYFDYIYIAICLIFSLAGVLVRFGNVGVKSKS